LYHTSIAKKIDLGYERNVIANANKILVVSNGMAELFKNKYPKYADKVNVIENGFDPDDFEIHSKASKNTFIISHTGSVSELYNIEGFVCALANVIKQHPDVPIKFIFVGIISKGIIDLFQKYSIAHIIETINYVPHKEVAEILKSSTILFLPIISSPNKEIVSAKVFEYLASRKPIICIASTDCDVAKIIDNCNSGKTIDYKDIQKSEDYLNSLLNLWKSGSNLDITNDEYLLYSRKNQAKTIEQLINSIL
jgi:glycosyltransferase involved in cell wall biosynthesis